MFVDIVPGSLPSISTNQIPSSAFCPGLHHPLIETSTLPESTCHPSGKYCPAVGSKLTVLPSNEPCHAGRLVVSGIPGTNGGGANLMGVVVLFVSSVSTR